LTAPPLDLNLKDSKVVGDFEGRIGAAYTEVITKLVPSVMPRRYKDDTEREVSVTASDGTVLGLAFIPEREPYEKYEPLKDTKPRGVVDPAAPHPEKDCIFCTFQDRKPGEVFGHLTGASGRRYFLTVNIFEYALDHVLMIAEDRVSNVFSDPDRLRDLLLFTAARGPGYETWANAQGGGASVGSHWHIQSAVRRAPLWNAIDSGRAAMVNPRTETEGLRYGELANWPSRVLLYEGSNLDALLSVVSKDMADLYENRIPPCFNARVLPDGRWQVAITPMSWGYTPTKRWLLSEERTPVPDQFIGTGAAEISTSR
jgi:hypothetical protein